MSQSDDQGRSESTTPGSGSSPQYGQPDQGQPQYGQQPQYAQQAPQVVPSPDPVQVPRIIELPQDTAAARRPSRPRPEEDDLDVPDFLK